MRVLVVCGGDSSEKEVSIKTGTAIYQALLDLQYISERYICNNKKDCINYIVENKPDVVFIALHGGWGEDGTLQAALEMFNIRYTGSNSLSSKICMNKFVTKSILSNLGIPTKKSYLIKNISELDSIDKFPLCLKPNSEGSSVGVEFVYNKKELNEKSLKLLTQYKEILAEEKVEGKELTLSIVNGECLPIIEIAPKSGFYDYKNKYTPGSTEYIIPAKINEAIVKKCNQIGETIYKYLYCKGAIRVDMILDGDTPYVLEVNTIPGMTQTSLLPNAAKHKDISFEELVNRILKSANEGF